jgi:hypothetical protein
VFTKSNILNQIIKSSLIIKVFISMTTSLDPFLSLRLVRNLSLKEGFPTGGNDVKVALLMNLLVILQKQ